MPQNVMKTLRASGPPPFANNSVVPEKLDLDLDNWRGHPENVVHSPSDVPHFPSTSPSIFPTGKSIQPTPSSSKSSTGRRWGFFSKKAEAKTLAVDLTPPASHNSELPGLTRNKSKPNVLKKPHTKSTPNLKPLVLGPADLGKVSALCAVPDLPPPRTPADSEPSPGGISLFSTDSRECQSPDSAIYFTVDPFWDPSKGDADIYLLPFPDVIEGSVPQCFAKDTAPRPRATTHGGKSPRSLKSVVKTDNETSFLFLK